MEDTVVGGGRVFFSRNTNCKGIAPSRQDVIKRVSESLAGMKIANLLHGRVAIPQINCLRVGCSNVLIMQEIHIRIDDGFSHLLDCTQFFSNDIPLQSDLIILPFLPHGKCIDDRIQRWRLKKNKTLHVEDELEDL